MDVSAAFESLHAEVRELLPAAAVVVDAHTHLGRDEDGQALDPAGLLASLDEIGPTARACTFPLHDPDREPAYRVPNDRVLRWAQESGGRLYPYCRLDPAEEPVLEAERCLALGARGIKLHPRAQAFGFADDAAESIWKVAQEANVPILVHAGRGMPRMDPLADLALRYPDVVVVLAHAAIADQGMFASRLRDHPNVVYDTSTFSVFDHLELLARVPVERIVFASDPPYGLPATSLYMALRVAAHAGLDEAAVRGMLGGTIAGLIDGRGLPPVTPPRRGSSVTLSGRLARVYGYGSLAGPAIFMGSAEQAQAMLEMALAACRDPDPGSVGEALATIETALGAAGAQLALETEDGTRAAIDLVYRAIVRAATELPDGG